MPRTSNTAKNMCVPWHLALLATTLIPALSLAGPEYVDRAVFPQGYSILTSDHLMFPQVVEDWPIKIDASRQLFVDDYVIAST
jgi:hypothetical protein